MKENRRFNPLIPVCVVLVLFLIGMTLLSVHMWKGKKTAEQEASQYRISYENLVEENKKAELAALEEKEKEEQLVEEYQNSYNMIVSYMLDDSILAENIGNLTVKVWHNAIWSTSDDETDKFTMKNGNYVADFNDALSALFSDEEYSQNCYTLASNQNQVKEEMKKMLNPPDGYENAFKALENMYNSYISFTEIVLNCNGSLESFSNDFAEADEDMLQKYHSVELYVK